MNLKELKSKLDEAVSSYRKIVHSAPSADVKKASDKVKELQNKISESICEGAKKCPTCGSAPHGMEQPRGADGVEYEVGCTRCSYFIHTDGTARDHGARGGILPRHTVEAWNEGPDAWKKKSKDRFSKAEWDALPKLDVKFKA